MIALVLLLGAGCPDTNGSDSVSPQDSAASGYDDRDSDDDHSDVEEQPLYKDEDGDGDYDEDGWLPPDDCDDQDPLSFPGAIDVEGPYDGIDQDCNGEDGPFLVDFTGAIAGDVDLDGVMDVIHYTWIDGGVVIYANVFLSSRGWDGAIGESFDSSNARGVGDLDGDTLGEIASAWPAFVGVWTGADLSEHPNSHHPDPTVWVPVPEMVNQSFGLVGDFDGGGGALIQVGEYVMPRERLVEPGFAVGQAPWHFPDIPVTQDGGTAMSFGPIMQAGDLDGDGLTELLAPDVLFPGELLSVGGSFPIADGEGIPGLGGFVGDVTGDGLDDAWVYEASADGAVYLVSGPLLEGAALTPFATIVGDADTFLPAAAGGLGDADDDGRADVGTGVGHVVEWDWRGDTHLFRGARLSGVLPVSDYDRRIGSRASTFDHLDFDGDGTDEPLFITLDGAISVLGGTPVFPTP